MNKKIQIRINIRKKFERQWYNSEIELIKPEKSLLCKLQQLWFYRYDNCRYKKISGWGGGQQ